MPRREKVEVVLSKAEGLEKKYDWAKAADLYEQALRLVGKRDLSRAGEIQERIGYCHQRRAFQAKSIDEFKIMMQRAVEVYEKAHDSYEKLTDKQKVGRISRCAAVARYLRYWLASNPTGKRKLLDECLELEAKALAAFSESGEMLEYGRTYSEFPLVFWLRVQLEWNKQTRESVYRRGLEWGERAVKALSKLGALRELAKSYLTLSTCLDGTRVFIAEPEKQEENRLKVVDCLSKAGDLSEKTGDSYSLGLSHCMHADNTEPEECGKHAEEAVECGRRTQDNLLIAWGLEFLAYLTIWKAIATEDPEKSKELEEKTLQFYDKAHHHYSMIPFTPRNYGMMNFPSGYAQHYMTMFRREPAIEKRLEFLKKAQEAGTEALRLAESSDMPGAINVTLAVIAAISAAQAQVESDLVGKRHHLKQVLKYKERINEIREQLTPFHYWNRGVLLTTLAKRKAELAKIEPDLEGKQRLLEEAISNIEEGLKLTSRMMPYYEKIGYFMLFAIQRRDQNVFATLLTRLYDLTEEPAYLRKAIKISQKAIDSAEKLDLVSLIAESYWKIAEAQDILGEHLKSAENFKLASESYKKATEKIPQLRKFYQDHASYLQAWNEIEKAKHYHTERQYGPAKEHYMKAADLHESTERWNYLSPNYLAWARLEEAEDLSRREQTEEAKDLFQQAAKLFEGAKKSIQAKLEKIESEEEKELLLNLTKASDIRREYCLGRIALEEARILDRKGDHTASSGKYGSAAETFQKMAKVESEQSRKELQPLIYLCKAWQKMMMAEAKASSALYGEAAELFKQAKEHTLDQPTSLFALANSSFCKALEAGTEFEITRDPTSYSAATQHLESAANYYLKAGYKTASEYTKATQRLFDAYVYMDNAKKQPDLEKKARYYTLAEKFLQASAGSYMKAKHPEKSEEVQRILESAKEEQLFAKSLTEVLHAPTTASTTTSFSTPTPTREQAVGLERFEHADVQATLLLRVKEANVGEDVGFRMELVNAGKAPALLIKVDEITPEGFEIGEVPEICTIEDSYLNLKGRRLNPLKTIDIKLTVKPQSKGTFSLKPRVLYIDETGKYKSHEPEPVTITVKELGIKGWIKGEK